MTAPTLSSPREVLPWDATRQDWLDARLLGITATDIAAICGLHPYRSAYEIWAEKVGDPFPDDAGEAAEIGRLLEPVVADLWSSRTGVPLRRVGLLAHPEHEWMLCTPDRLLVTDPLSVGWESVTGLLEIKTALGYTMFDWEETVAPDAAQLQVAWQLGVSGLDRATIAALVGPSLKSYDIDRDQAFIDDLMTIGERFLRENVAKRVPPPPDGTDRLAQLLSKRWTPDPDRVVVLDPTVFEPLRQTYWGSHDEIDAVKARKVAAGNAVRLLMGDAEAAVIDGETVATWKAGKSGTRTLNIKKAKP